MEKTVSCNLESWFMLNETIGKSSSMNDNVRRILQNNKDFRQHFGLCGNDDFFSLVIDNMKDLEKEVFNNVRQFSGVLRIALELSKHVQFTSAKNYVNSFKIFMLVLRTNQDFVRQESSVLELPVASVCKSFCVTFKRIAENLDAQQLKFAQLQLRIIVELQKMFADKFRGTSHIVSAVVDLQTFVSENNVDDKLQELVVKLQSVLFAEFSSANFYASFFFQLRDPSEPELRFVLELCVEVLKKIIDNESFLAAALPADASTNFCLQSIKFLAKYPQTIQTHAMLFDEIIFRISQLLSARSLSDESFKFLEREIITAMVQSEDFWTSEIFFIVFNQFLGISESEAAISTYFVLFQKLLKKLWHPATEISTRCQLHVFKIVQFIMKQHPLIAQNNVIDKEIAEVLMEAPGRDCQLRFKRCFDSLIETQNVTSYYELMHSLKLLKNQKFDQETVEKFSELVRMTENCDWKVNCGLIRRIMQVIIDTDNNQQKLIFLLKLNPALNDEKTKPFELKLKLVELLFSFIKLAELKQGLPGLVTRELNRLCKGPESDAIITRKIVNNLSEGESIPWNIINSLNVSPNIDDNEEENQLEIFLSSRGLKTTHICPEIADPEPSQTLATFFNFLQTQNFNQNDVELLENISLTCQNIKKRLKN